MYSYDSLLCPGKMELAEKLRLAELRLKAKQKEFNCYPEWTVYFKTDPEIFLVQVELGKKRLNGNIEYRMPLNLFYAILSRKIHFNNALVGCHFEIFREPNVYDPDIDTLLCFFHA